ncbi:MAG: hypothetical protein H7A37_08615 [Chlamydiales bacterium]|nr:hypothetical protein [Chlamydiia bacterium]MCP5508341.1 hypothetical protein [Chlamydiales bacterium]
MKLPFQIEIPKRSAACCAGEERLEPGMDYFSILVDSDGDEFMREDYCSACWTAKAENLPDAMLTHWKSKVIDQKQAQEDLFKSRDEKALALLKELSQSEEAEKQSEAFILCLYLARKRHLYHRKDIDEGQVGLYEVAATEEMLPIKKISLADIDAEKIQKEIARKLKV